MGRWHLRWALREAWENRGEHSRWGPHHGQRHRDVKMLGCLGDWERRPAWKAQLHPECSNLKTIILTALFETHFHITCWTPGTLLGVQDAHKKITHSFSPYRAYGPLRRNATRTEQPFTKCVGATCKVCSSV